MFHKETLKINKMKKPLVSIIVPCHNQAIFLDDALLSVKNQTYLNWECIVVNDGSSDNTEECVKKWVTGDARFKYLEQKNKGVSNARNNAIKSSEGKFILPLDADDVISNDYVELAIIEFQKNKALKVVYSNVEKFGLVNRYWNLDSFSLHTLAKNNVIVVSALFKKSDWLKINGYDENMKEGLEDWDFWISMLKNGGEVLKLDKICFFYRISKNSRNNSINAQKLNRIETYLSKKHCDFFINELGAFPSLARDKDNYIREFKVKLDSEKFLINAFTSKFLNFKVFKLKNF